jgi:Flp pilus assembly protein protease CpaA
MSTKVFDLVILAWLCAAAWQDVRTHAVSNWLTVLPLAAVVAWRLVCGDIAPALLLCVCLAVDALPALAASAIVSIVCVATAAIAGDALLPAVWAVAYAAWRFNVIAGADAKLAMALVTLFPDPRLTALIVGAALLISLVVLIARGHTGDTLVITALRLRHLSLPTRQELEAKGVPLAGAFVLAFGAWLAVGRLA